MTKEMADVHQKLKDGIISPDVAAEMNKTFANMIRTCQVRINYSQARGEKPVIPMLEKDQPAPLRQAA
jgi:hypothetical protein